MDLEWHQLDRRYEGLRSRHPAREKRLLASLATAGQQMPIVVVPAGGERFVVVDGYKRVRALQRLGHDHVRATPWQLEEADALLLERTMRAAEAESALSQGWLLQELHDRFGLSLEELARRVDKSVSWVSRRLALVGDLPPAVQEYVRLGEVVAHAAMKYFVPLARANRQACLRLAEAVAGKGLSSRDIAELYTAYRSAGSEAAQELVLASPLLVLRARAQAREEDKDRTPAEKLADELGVLAAVARRAAWRLRASPLRCPAVQRETVAHHLRDAQADCLDLFHAVEEELGDAGPGHAHSDLATG